MTLIEQERLDAEARQRRIRREGFESQITVVERRLATIDSEIAGKKKLLTELAELEAAALELPPQVQARRSGIGASITIPCLRTELITSLAGARQAQAARLDNLVVRRDAETKQLDQLREGVKVLAA
jgi:hypothetical protein